MSAAADEIFLGPYRPPMPDRDHLISIVDSSFFVLLRLSSPDGTNRLTQATLGALESALGRLALTPKPVIIAGNEQFFSAGADLREIARLNPAAGYEFSRAGQKVMTQLDEFPATTIAAISGYCFGGALDLALACDIRIAARGAVFGHRGAALGLITGWGGTQRLPRLIGKARALQMFCAAEKLGAQEALRIGLVSAVADDPVEAAAVRCEMLNVKSKK
ncbi:MAG: enoyl-CoA hydratase/isomerase family protein [Acidobacteria bacterium]|nr:enoyl-CoA hydratase/isomerase family protein [Acidobacteriota bacterium]